MRNTTMAATSNSLNMLLPKIIPHFSMGSMSRHSPFAILPITDLTVSTAGQQVCSYLIFLQGTNAHAIVSVVDDSDTSELSRPAPWQHKTFWHLPQPHILLQRHITDGRGSEIKYHAQLMDASLGYLMDNMVHPLQSFSLLPPLFDNKYNVSVCCSIH